MAVKNDRVECQRMKKESVSMEVSKNETSTTMAIKEFVQSLADPSKLDQLEFVANVACWSDGDVTTTVLGKAPSQKVLPFIDEVRNSIDSHNPPEERARRIGKFSKEPRWDFEELDDLFALMRHEFPFEDFEYFENRFLLDYAFLVEEARSEVEARYCQECLVRSLLPIKFRDDVFASDPKLNDRLAARIEYFNEVRALEKKESSRELAQSIVEEGSK
jgi:hypothetical protein